MRKTLVAFIALLAITVTTGPLRANEPSDAARDAKIAEPVTINAQDYRLTPETFRLVASRALLQRNWRIIASEPTRVQGSLTKHRKNPPADIEYRVDIRQEGQKIVIGFVPGYHSERPNWLRNLEKDMLIELQLQSLPK
jgi:hypothetical protein